MTCLFAVYKASTYCSWGREPFRLPAEPQGIYMDQLSTKHLLSGPQSLGPCDCLSHHLCNVQPTLLVCMTSSVLHVSGVLTLTTSSCQRRWVAFTQFWISEVSTCQCVSCRFITEWHTLSSFTSPIRTTTHGRTTHWQCFTSTIEGAKSAHLLKKLWDLLMWADPTC